MSRWPYSPPCIRGPISSLGSSSDRCNTNQTKDITRARLRPCKRNVSLPGQRWELTNPAVTRQIPATCIFPHLIPSRQTDDKLARQCRLSNERIAANTLWEDPSSSEASNGNEKHIVERVRRSNGIISLRHGSLLWTPPSAQRLNSFQSLEISVTLPVYRTMKEQWLHRAQRVMTRTGCDRPTALSLLQVIISICGPDGQLRPQSF